MEFAVFSQDFYSFLIEFSNIVSDFYVHDACLENEILDLLFIIFTSKSQILVIQMFLAFILFQFLWKYFFE